MTGLVKLISQAEYAKHRGVSEAAVSKAVKVGRISLIDGKIDPVAADAQWAANSRARVGKGGPVSDLAGASAGVAALENAARGRELDAEAGAEKPGDDGYWKSRSRREAAEALAAELRVAEQAGKLIQVSAVEKVWATAFASAREHLMQMRARLASQLAAESDPFKVDQMLDEEISAALAHLSGVSLQPKAAR